tara:strand:+ start:185 stop:454 length:270 start_codon:yes stop_codon:yes gene_type:complete
VHQHCIRLAVTTGKNITLTPFQLHTCFNNNSAQPTFFGGECLCASSIKKPETFTVLVGCWECQLDAGKNYSAVLGMFPIAADAVIRAAF